MTDLSAHRDALTAFFAARDTVAGVVARRLLGQPGADDTDLADHLIRQRRRRSSMDGSIDHALVPTARALSEILDLGAPGDHAAVVRLSGYLLGRQDAPGRWGEAEGTGAGFFSPGPVDQVLAPLTVHTGMTFEDESDARFAASCITLRAVLRAGHENRAAVRAHVSGLLGLDPMTLDEARAGLVLAALAAAAPEYRTLVGPWVDRMASADQLPPAHFFAALVPVPDKRARHLVRDRLTAIDPVPPDADEGIALRYARATATASLAE